MTCAQSRANESRADALHMLRAPCCCAWPDTTTGGKAASVAHCLPSAQSTRCAQSGNLPACNWQRCIDRHGRETVQRSRNPVAPQACPQAASQQLPSPQSDPGAAGHPRPAGLVQQPKQQPGEEVRLGICKAGCKGCRIWCRLACILVVLRYSCTQIAGPMQQPRPREQGMHVKWAAAQPRSDQSWLGAEPGIYACLAGRWFFCAMHALGIGNDHIDCA